MAKSRSRSSFLVGIYIVTVCFFGSSKAQSGYGGPKASVYNIGGPRPNDGISENSQSDMNTRPAYDTDASDYEGTTSDGGEQYQWTNGYQSYGNAAYGQNSNYMRNPNYYYASDTLYDDEMQNIRDPSSDDLLPVDGEGSAYWSTYASQNPYYDSSQQMDCGNYNTQYERDLCQRNVGGAQGNTINGRDSYQSTGDSSGGSLSGSSQSSYAGESYSNRMGSSNQAGRGRSNGRNPGRRVRPGYRSRYQSSATPGRSPSYYTDASQRDYTASSQNNYASSSQFEYNDSSQVRTEGSNRGNLGGSPQRPSRYRSQSSQTGQRQGNVDRPSPSYVPGPSRPVYTASSTVGRTDSSQFNNRGSSQASSKGSGGNNVGRPSQSSSSSSYSYQTGPSRPVPTASPQVSHTGSSQSSNKGSSQASSSGGSNVGRPSQPSSSSSQSYQTGPSRPVPADSSQVSYTGSSQSSNKGSSQASSKGSGGRNVARPSQPSFKAASQYSDMGAYGGNAASPSGPIPIYYTQSSQPNYPGSSQTVFGQRAYADNSFLDTNFGPTNPDSDRIILSFNGYLKVLYGQFNEIRDQLLRYLDQVSNRVTAQVPVENQPGGFVPIMDDGTTSVVQLNWNPSSALQQLYRRANGLIFICNEYLKNNGVDLIRGGEYEASRDLKNLLSSLYQTGVLITQGIGSNTVSALHPLSPQYQSDWNVKLRNFMISLRNVGNVFDGYINKVITAKPTSYSQGTTDPRRCGNY